MRIDSVCYNCPERHQGCHKGCEKAAREQILRAILKSTEDAVKTTDYGVRQYKNHARDQRKSNPSQFARIAVAQMKDLSNS